MPELNTEILAAPIVPVPELKLETVKAPLAVAGKQVEMPKTKLQEKWNTKNLGWRLASDLVAAASAASLVAPIISIIDR